MSQSDDLILLFWNCPECGHEHIEGPTKRCPRCFYWRDRAVAFYEAPDSRVLTPDEAMQYQRPDWICKVCGAANADEGQPVAELICGNCQSWQTNHLDLGQAAPDRLGDDTVAAVQGQWQEGFRLDQFEDLNDPQFSAALNDPLDSSWAPSNEPAPPPPPDRPAPAPARPWKKQAIAAGLAMAIGGTGWAAWQWIAPVHLDATVVQRTWAVSVPIEDYRPVEESGWSLPAGAYDISSSRRQRGTRQVQTGTRTESVQVSYQEQTGTQEECTTRSRGDGTGQRTCKDVPVYSTRYRTERKEVPVYRAEPVYDTWYRYKIQRWVAQTSIERRGSDREPRRPPAVTLDNRPYPERALSPIERCSITADYADPKQRSTRKRDTFELPCDHYDRLAIGQTARFERSGQRLKLLDATKVDRPAAAPQIP
jgi:hypothetical protein